MKNKRKQMCNFHNEIKILLLKLRCENLREIRQNSYLTEQLNILRRISERGLSLAISNEHPDENEKFIDLFVHLLDEIERTKLSCN